MCEYCTCKKPREGATAPLGNYPVGKYIIRGDDGFIAIREDNGTPVIPAPTSYSIELSLFGVGIGHRINFCPMCGRDLRGGELCSR